MGPNSEEDKATILGEAAHIFGANSGSARFDPSMSENSRGAITNGIWLCANCHTMVDKDVQAYSAALLFRWREIHDDFVASELSSISDKIRFEERASESEKFSSYPPIIRRIVMDRPTAWEWSLTAELLRYLSAPHMRKLRDVRRDLYTRPLQRVKLEDFIDWTMQQTSRMQGFFSSLAGIIENLNEALGKPGEPGDLEEIHHSCLLINDFLKQAVLFEEDLKFIHADEECVPLINLLRGVIASQAEKILEIPESLDKVILLLDTEHEGTKEKPLIVTHSLECTLPDNWLEKMNAELERIKNIVMEHQQEGL